MIQIALTTLGVLYLIGYIVFFIAALLDVDTPKTIKFISTLLLISLVWPIAFTMYVLSSD